tara:strand:+ start:33 stop:800 length:768 start_codon:yes stop_codon:yes gene_type:complete
MTNSKDIPSDFEGLDLDQSLEKIIKETPLEDLERDEIINILKVKLNDKNSSTKDDQLTFSETLSFIKETKKLLGLGSDKFDKDSFYYLNRADEKEHSGDLQGAIDEVTKAISLKPNHEDFMGRGFLYLKLNKFDDALNDFSEAIKIHSSNAGYYFARATAKNGLRDFHGALNDLSTAINMHIDFTDAYHLRGTIKTKSGDTRGAIDDFSKALEIEPDKTISFFLRSASKMKLGDEEGAQTDQLKFFEPQNNNETN